MARPAISSKLTLQLPAEVVILLPRPPRLRRSPRPGAAYARALHRRHGLGRRPEPGRQEHDCAAGPPARPDVHEELARTQRWHLQLVGRLLAHLSLGQHACGQDGRQQLQDRQDGGPRPDHRPGVSTWLHRKPQGLIRASADGQRRRTRPFGERIWVGIRLPAPPTPPPPPTQTPAPGISFGADRMNINAGECVNFNWNVTGVRAAVLYPQGQPFQGSWRGRAEQQAGMPRQHDRI